MLNFDKDFFPNYGNNCACEQRVGAGISTLMSTSDGLGPFIFFSPEVESTGPMRKDLDGKVFISRQSQRFYFHVFMMKVLFSFCTLTWRVNNYASREGAGIYRRIGSARGDTKIVQKLLTSNCIFE